MATANVLLGGSRTCGSRRGGAIFAGAAFTVASVRGGLGVAAAKVRARCTGHCRGGGGRWLGGWPGRVANAAAVQAARATAAAVVFVGGLAGGARRVVAAAAVRNAQAPLPRWSREQAGRWPERVSAATAVQAARATAASGGFVGGWAGGGCRGGAGCTGAADTVVKMGCCAGGGCNWGKRPQVAPLVALLVGGSAQGGYRSGVGVAWRLSVVAGAVVAVEWTGKRVTASVVVKVGVCMGGGCCCGARGGV